MHTYICVCVILLVDPCVHSAEKLCPLNLNAATRYSARPFTTKTGARVHFFCLNSPRNRGWYQARVHPFSSGNGKGDVGGLK